MLLAQGVFSVHVYMFVIDFNSAFGECLGQWRVVDLCHDHGAFTAEFPCQPSDIILYISSVLQYTIFAGDINMFCSGKVITMLGCNVFLFPTDLVVTHFI